MSTSRRVASGEALRCPVDGNMLGHVSADGTAIRIRCSACRRDHMLVIVASLGFIEGKPGRPQRQVIIEVDPCNSDEEQGDPPD